jgi:hypothetical protein
MLTVKIFLLFLLTSVAIFAAHAHSDNNGQNRIGLLISGNGQFSFSFVKTGDFPIGAQLGYNSGGSVGYGWNKYDFLLNFNFHDAFYSFKAGHVLYRRYKGFITGMSLRYHEEEDLLTYDFFSNLGVGVTFDGVFDRYYLIDQYMVYPRLGVELYSAFRLIPKWNLFIINLVAPVTYSFRQSGNYLETGLKIETMLRF